MNKSTTQIVSLIIAYLASGILTYSAIAMLSKDSSPISPAGTSSNIPSTGLQIDPNEPQDQACPINGQMFTQTERNAWESKRPVLAMIENHTEARPQSGLSRADIVYEAVAEGGITRFMGVFYCGAQADLGTIAPVRSARMYFVNLAAGYNTPVYVHVGGGNCSRDEGTGQCTSNKKAWALEELADLGWRVAGGNDFDTIFDTGVPQLKRDQNRLGTDRRLATEHTMVGDLAAIWQQAAKRGFTNKKESGDDWIDGFRAWQFDEKNYSSAADDAQKVSFGFWANTPDFDIVWQYDTQTKLYRRTMGGTAHKDLETDQQIAARTVITQFVEEEGPLDIHKHMYYEVIGTGDATIHFDGKYLSATWKKTAQDSRTVFYDEDGEEVVFPGGQIWVELLPDGNKVSYD